MADPETYAPGYSFSGYQATNPALPLPAQEIDRELATLETVLQSFLDAIIEVRRADGNLQNGIVTWDGLAEDVQARILGSDPRVTNADINPAAYATQIEAEAGVANDRLMTPLRVGQALDALRAFSSQAQAQAGTDAQTVLSPVRGVDMLNALRAFASQAEAEAGTAADRVVSPLRGAQQIAALRPAATASASLTWGSIASLGSSAQAIVCPGAEVGDRVMIGLPAAGVDAGLIPQAWVSTTDTVTLRLTNVTAAPITPAGGAAATYSVTAARF